MRIAYVFTTFPKLSERFFLREVLELQRQGVPLDLYSMVGGADDSEAGTVTRMKALDWIRVWWELCVWLVRAPGVVFKLLLRLNPFLYRSVINWGENALGVAFAVRFARHFGSSDYAYAHGTWATAPGMAVWGIQRLIGQTYTLEAHAYDVFRDGGDAFLGEKLAGAQALRSSTESTCVALRGQLSAVGSALLVVCVRRGLDQIPEYRIPEYRPGAVLRVLSVGRLIEKKGYSDQLELFAAWLSMGVSFKAQIVGDGELRKSLESRIAELGLDACVQFMGKLNYAEVDAVYRNSDLFLFCGKVSASGDRDGFPNVIGEAMSHSLPVFSTDVSGTTEGVKHGISGYIISTVDVRNTATEIYLRMQSVNEIARMTRNAHAWINEDFSTVRNVRKLRAALWASKRAEC